MQTKLDTWNAASIHGMLDSRGGYSTDQDSCNTHRKLILTKTQCYEFNNTSNYRVISKISINVSQPNNGNFAKPFPALSVTALKGLSIKSDSRIPTMAISGLHYQAC